MTQPQRVGRRKCQYSGGGGDSSELSRRLPRIGSTAGHAGRRRSSPVSRAAQQTDSVLGAGNDDLAPTSAACGMFHRVLELAQGIDPFHIDRERVIGELAGEATVRTPSPGCNRRRNRPRGSHRTAAWR